MTLLNGGRAACAAVVALALAGCSTASNGTSSVSADGHTLTIYMSAPTDYASNPQQADTIRAEQLAFDQDAHSVTAYTLRMQLITAGELSAHARQAISNTGAIAYIGELAPGDSEQTAGITEAQDLLQVSPTDTALELTQPTPVVPTGRPKYFLESTGTYGKTFARIVPSSAVEAKATVAEMKQLGVTSLTITADGSYYGQAIAQAVRLAAPAAGISITTSRSTAGAIFYGGTSAGAAATAFMSDAQANPTAKLFGPSALDTPALTAALTTPPASLYISTPGVLSSAQPPAYATFAAAFQAKYGHAPASGAAFGYESMAAVINVIAGLGHNGNNRGSVVRKFFHLTNRASAVGTYSINPSGNGQGDSSLTSFVFNKLKNGALKPVASAQG